jgi:hypothetical protein
MEDKRVVVGSWTLWRAPGHMRQSRGRLTPNDGWGLMYEFVVGEGIDHEESEVYAAGRVTL